MQDIDAFGVCCEHTTAMNSALDLSVKQNGFELFAGCGDAG